MIDLRDSDERSAAVGEYVLGTLTDEDHAAMRSALAVDVALRGEVYAWQDRLLALSARAAPLDPRPSIWRRIEASLANQHPATRPRAALPIAPRMPWWRSVLMWQAVSASAVAASIVLALMLLFASPIGGSGERYVAVLQSPDGRSTGWVVEMQKGRQLRLVPVGNEAAAAPAGRALQFWTKPEGAAGPTSLGLVRAGQVLELPVSRLPAVEARQLFEVTLEPENGSPVGRPTGPILYVGKTVSL